MLSKTQQLNQDIENNNRIAKQPKMKATEKGMSGKFVWRKETKIEKGKGKTKIEQKHKKCFPKRGYEKGQEKMEFSQGWH